MSFLQYRQFPLRNSLNFYHISIKLKRPKIYETLLFFTFKKIDVDLEPLETFVTFYRSEKCCPENCLER